MASYLKFDGVNDELRVTIPVPDPTLVTSLVLTAFVRFLTFPRWSAPVMRFVNLIGTPYSHTALWLRGSEANKNSQLAMQGYLLDEVNYVRTATGMVPTVGATIPFRLGQIYKLQLVFAYDVSLSLHALGLFVDGVRVREIYLADAPGNEMPHSFDSDIDFVIGGIGSSPDDTYFTDVNLRYPRMDIIQAKWELDRTVTFIGGTNDRLPVLDGDSDPFTNMTLDGSATDGGLYLMNEGTGTTVADSSGNGHDITLAGTSVDPSWAPAADPAFPSTGVARWTFASVEGYALRHSDVPDVVPQPIFVADASDKTAGELRLRLKPWDWFEDGTALTAWTVSTGLAASTTQSRESGSSIRANNATAVSDRDVSPAAAGTGVQKRWMRAWFYDPGGTDTGRLQRLTLYDTFNTIEITVGRHNAISTTHYCTTVAGSGNTASSVAVSVGWHEFLIYHEALAPTGPWAIRIYIDGVLVRTDTAIDSDGFSAQVGLRQAATGTNGDGYWDFWQLNANADAEHHGLVAASGTSPAFPKMQPSEGVAFFRGFTVTEVTAGVSSMEVGTTLYEFRHSINGGSSYGSWTTLSNANLQALDCVGNGQDALQVRVTQTASMDDMGSPATREVEIRYEPARKACPIEEAFRGENPAALNLEQGSGGVALV